MTTSAAENLAGHPAVEKKEEKVEKRRALGRGLESLLPGPRVVVPSPESRVPSTAAGRRETSAAASDGGGEQQIPHFVRNDKVPGSNASGDKASEEMERKSDRSVRPTRAVAATRLRRLFRFRPWLMPANMVANLSIDLIEKNPYQTRYVFDEEMLQELRDSIKEHGVVQPVVVRPAEEEGRYILVLGERRLRASKMAGKDTIPALVRRLSPQQAAEMTVLENVVREDLNPIEQAEAFRVLSLQFKLTQVQIADRIGVSRETVANYMRLLRLPEKVMSYMLEERLSFSDAREIVAAGE